MISQIIIAAFSLIGTITGAYLASRKSLALIAYRLEQVEKEVNKNNCLVEKIYAIEKFNVLVQEQIKVINNRLKDLETL